MHARTLPRVMGEHGHENIRSIDLPYIYSAPRVTGPVAQGHGVGVARIDDNGLSGARFGGKQYHGCRDQQGPTYYVFRMGVGARMAICGGRMTLVRCVFHAGGQRSPRLIDPCCPPLSTTDLYAKLDMAACATQALNGCVLEGAARQ
jgi:hypothetical protein